jgi:hypothetical protein
MRPDPDLRRHEQHELVGEELDVRELTGRFGTRAAEATDRAPV